jgi:hypothetical protein
VFELTPVFWIGEKGQVPGTRRIQRRDTRNRRAASADYLSAQAGDDLVEPQRHGRGAYFVPSPSALITLSVMSMRGLT